MILAMGVQILSTALIGRSHFHRKGALLALYIIIMCANSVQTQDQPPLGSNATYPEHWGDISRRKGSRVLPPSQITLLHL